MSKMSQLHAELTQEAYDLGFDSLEDALNHGYVPEYDGGKLVPTEEIMKQSHEEWLKEKDEVISGLKSMLDLWKKPYTNYELVYALGQCQNIIGKAIEFIQKGEM